MVGLDGLEPSTSRLSGVRSNHLSYRPLLISVGFGSSHLGGDDGVRTHDPLLAGQVLSQLSYTPIKGIFERSSKIEQRKVNLHTSHISSNKLKLRLSLVIAYF